VDGFAAPVDIAWKTDVNRHEPCSHFLLPTLCQSSTKRSERRTKASQFFIV
jgi:hypothetical protein